MPTRPPLRPKTPIKCMGVYVGLAGQKAGLDFEEIASDLYNHGYNQISIFLSTVFNNTGLWPWKLVGTKFDFTQDNEDYYTHYENLVDTFSFWRIVVHNKFVDQFHEEPGKDPFKQAFGDDVEALYSSWDGSKYRHTKWDEPKPRVYTNFIGVNDVGRGIIRWVKRIAAINAKISKKYPDFRTSTAWANETHALFHEGESHPYKTRGDREEMTYFVRKTFEAAGFTINKKLLVYFDYLAFRPDIHTIDKQTMAKVSKDLSKRGYHLEIHGILTLQEISGLITAGVNGKATMFSTDGDLRMEADYPGLGKSSYHTDLKFDIKKNEPWSSTDMMVNWRKYRERYKDYVK